MSVSTPPDGLRVRRMYRRFTVYMRERLVLDAPPFTVSVAARSIAAARHVAMCQHPTACVIRVVREESS